VPLFELPMFCGLVCRFHANFHNFITLKIARTWQIDENFTGIAKMENKLQFLHCFFFADTWWAQIHVRDPDPCQVGSRSFKADPDPWKNYVIPRYELSFTKFELLQNPPDLRILILLQYCMGHDFKTAEFQHFQTADF
jgi:hypothetical protein